MFSTNAHPGWHVRLDFQSLLPRMVIDQARPHDNIHARALCAGVKAGEIVIGNRAYLDLEHLLALFERGVFWGVREKENFRYDVIEKRAVAAVSGILRDEIIMLNKRVQAQRVAALVEVNGEEREMIFLTNNFAWSARAIADLYRCRCRWQIEVFFKQLKQTLQLADFLGNSKNAVKWQLWTALLLMLLLRYLAYLGWGIREGGTLSVVVLDLDSALPCGRGSVSVRWKSFCQELRQQESQSPSRPAARRGKLPIKRDRCSRLR